MTEEQQANLDTLVDSLVKQGVLSLNYQGLDDKAVGRVAQETQQPVLAIGAPFPLPFFDLQHLDSKLVITGGLNALMGRSGLRKEAQPYSLTVQLAYQDKATTGDRQPEHEAEPLDSRHTTRESQRETAKMTNEPAPSTSQAASKPLPTRESRRHRHGE